MWTTFTFVIAVLDGAVLNLGQWPTLKTSSDGSVGATSAAGVYPKFTRRTS
jgi:hypothetical protein